MFQAGVGWGLATAAAWGVADFAGGVASRRAAPVAVTAASQLVGLALLVSAVVLVQPPVPAPDVLLLGAVAGLGGGLGLAFLYEGLARGAMGIVSALAGAGSAVVPLLVSMLLGTAVPPVALVGVSLVVGAGLAAADVSRDAASRSALLLSLGAAIGFSAWYLLIDRAAGAGGIWALVASRTASSVLMVVLVAVTGARSSIPALRPVLPFILAAGVLDVGANVFFIVARGEISVGLAATLSGLYPLVTMFMARLVLGERLPRLGVLSVLLAVTGTILISVSR